MANIKVPLKCGCGCGVKIGFVTCPSKEKGKWENHDHGHLNTPCAIRLRKAKKLKADEGRHFFEAAKEAVITGVASEAQKRLVFEKLFNDTR